MSSESYTVLYYVALFFHYFVLYVVVVWLLYKKLKFPFLKGVLLWFVIWLLTVVVFSGCPFTHIENYIAYKAWGTENNYNLKQSIAYKIVLKYAL